MSDQAAQLFLAVRQILARGVEVRPHDLHFTGYRSEFSRSVLLHLIELVGGFLMEFLDGLRIRFCGKLSAKALRGLRIFLFQLFSERMRFLQLLRGRTHSLRYGVQRRSHLCHLGVVLAAGGLKFAFG